MKDDEILTRLFYLDIKFERLAKEHIKDQWSKREFEEKFTKIREKSETLDINKIKEDLLEGDLPWFNRFKGILCENLEVEINLLCIDDGHAGTPFHGNRYKRGDLLVNIISTGIPDNRTGSLIKSPHLNFLQSNLPIVVRRYRNLFEVMSGNHRALALISKGYKKINVLSIKN